MTAMATTMHPPGRNFSRSTTSTVVQRDENGHGLTGGSATARPRRTCIGCRRVADPAELVRVARRPDGMLAVGRTEPGRGAWLCAGSGPGASPKVSAACFEAAVRRRAFGRALRCEVTPDQVANLRERLV